jgi:hypothetical protein
MVHGRKRKEKTIVDGPWSMAGKGEKAIVDGK